MGPCIHVMVRLRSINPLTVSFLNHHWWENYVFNRLFCAKCHSDSKVNSSHCSSCRRKRSRLKSACGNIFIHVEKEAPRFTCTCHYWACPFFCQTSDVFVTETLWNAPYVSRTDQSLVRPPCPWEDFRHTQWSEVLAIAPQPPPLLRSVSSAFSPTPPPLISGCLLSESPHIQGRAGWQSAFSSY